MQPTVSLFKPIHVYYVTIYYLFTMSLTNKQKYLITTSWKAYRRPSMRGRESCGRAGHTDQPILMSLHCGLQATQNPLQMKQSSTEDSFSQQPDPCVNRYVEHGQTHLSPRPGGWSRDQERLGFGLLAFFPTQQCQRRTSFHPAPPQYSRTCLHTHIHTYLFCYEYSQIARSGTRTRSCSVTG